MNQEMLGYQKQAALSFILSGMDKSVAGAMKAELPELLSKMIDAHLSFLHVCGALNEAGDTGEGEYDEDDAFEYVLDAVSAGCSEQKIDAIALVLDSFFPLQDAWMQQEGLLG